MSEPLAGNWKPRVLVLSASSSAGQVRAAQALEKAIRGRGDCIVEHIDALTHVSRVFQQLYDKAYISMVRRAPELMGTALSAHRPPVATSATTPGSALSMKWISTWLQRLCGWGRPVD